MRTNRRWAVALGLLLLLPLAGALVASVAFTTTCDFDCGDMGGRGLFVLVLLCTPPGAAGVFLVGVTRRSRGRIARLANKLAGAAVGFCTVVLAGAAFAAGVEGVNQLTTDPPIHHIGQTEPSQFDREQAREAGTFWLVIATVLTAMAATAVLALRAAWRKRR